MATSRRDFLKASASVAAGLAASRSVARAETEPTPATPAGPTVRKGDMLYRTLGRTGEQVSLIGLGGYHLGQPDEAEAIRIVRTAVDRGVTFMDNCWDYNGGASEIRMGKALRGGYRDKVFLMTKIDGRTRQAAARQIDESLGRLQTDHLDLLQYHEVIRLEDPDRIFANGGAHEAMAEAQKAGKVRHVGFTGHKDPYVHLRMLDAARAHGVHFDAVQMPLNVMDAHFRSFQHQVLPVLLKEQIGPLAMKSMGASFILESGVVTPIECLHYTMSLPVSVVITGVDRMEILDQALEAIRTFRPMTPEQTAALLARTAAPAAAGAYELFKTSAHFDGTAHNPDWLG
jgi:aryl-alcohol dehydrogenase-like predicted oxidoreductase